MEDHFLALKYQQMTEEQKIALVEEQKSYLRETAPEYSAQHTDENLTKLCQRSNTVADSIGLTTTTSFAYLCFLSLTTGEELINNEEFIQGIKNDEESPDACIKEIMDLI